MTARTGKLQAKLRHNAGGFVLKKKLCLFIFLQMICLLFYAQAKKQNHVRQKKEVTMKEKIIWEFLEKNGDIEIYDCFRFVCEDDAILKLYYIRKMKDFALDWLMNKADNPEYKIFGSRLHFPMEKIPDVVKTMTDAFYLGNPLEGRWSYTIALPDSEFTAGLSFDERSWVMDEYSLIQDDGDKIWEDIDLYWDMETKSKVPLKGTRVMPKSLAALIEGLRDFYNEWQKAHPECERME